LNFDLLKALTETPGIASREDHVRGVAVQAIRPLVDDVRFDALGNAIGRKRGKAGRRVMIAAHLDEIGFFVRYIDSRGFLRLQPVGGFDARALFAQRVVVTSSHGGVLRGTLMPGAKPPHLLAGEEPKSPKVDEFFVDLGLPEADVKATVEIGDMVTLDGPCERVGQNITAKAMDDRVGVFVLIEALRALRSHEVEILAALTVEEEVGLRGATTAGFDLEPNVAIALDVTLARDTPGTPDQDTITRLGGGAAIKVMDSSLICDPRLVRDFREVARRHDVPFQLEVLPRGGTDAGAIQRSRGGVPAITLSIPTRYVHTVDETVSESDVEACINLLARYLEEAHTFNYAVTA
jgi:endoglucanase